MSTLDASTLSKGDYVSSYLAIQQSIVCVLHPRVSWIRRARHSTTGATIHDQKNCQTNEGHLNTSQSQPRCQPCHEPWSTSYHSQPVVCRVLTSHGFPWTSVPWMPNEGWNFLDRRYMTTVRRNYSKSAAVHHHCRLATYLLGAASPHQ